VPDGVRALWRESATLAAETVAANSELTALAIARRADVAGRLARLAAGRRGLASYRPGDAARAGIADRRA
jgi:hypothetical protein